MPDEPSLLPLEGRVAVVTGASSGLGVAFADALAGAGADIVICARRTDLLADTKALVEGHGRRCVAVRADIAVEDDCRAVVDAAVDEFGRLDVLVNNAGVGTAAPATRERAEDFRRVLDVNVTGAFLMARAAARVMRPGSSIVNVGSVLGSTTAGLPQAAYCSSKAAIIGLTRDLAQEWSGRMGIRVNTLAPGVFPSDMTAQLPPESVDRTLMRIPMGRLGRPEELAATAVFLASDAASYITGIVLPVDGGLLTA
jgi:NAD(P)-dependent dehydrogenase (short-subunit alcohol dehydrogenase family)